MKIINRTNDLVDFDKSKIINAITKSMKLSSGGINDKVVEEIALEIEIEVSTRERTTISDIENLVFNKLVSKGQVLTAKSYESYRAIQSYKRSNNTIDDSILKLLSVSNKEVSTANSNKDASVLSTQRDLIAGEVSKDIMLRYELPSNIALAHNSGMIHYHDLDYAMQKGMFNCCLINIEDMLDNGTVINEIKISQPNSFQTACNIMTQIIANVASSQYGGQSVNIKYLGKYLRKSYNKAYNLWKSKGYSDSESIKYAESVQKVELSSGVQTIQYQINTLNTTNGQSPFVTIFLWIEEDYEYEYEVALIVEEILKQRIQGVQSPDGTWITPTFPKLVYVLDENNNLSGGKYDYITRIAAECTSKRMYPDYISAKLMRENYDGNVFSPMGCRSYLSPWYDSNGNTKFEGRFNQGVVSLNLSQVAILAKGDHDKFKSILDDRLQICFEALMHRHNSLRGTTSDVSPIHWQYGAIARLSKGEIIDKYLYGGYSTISLGYIGVYETTKLMTGESHTTKVGQEFALNLMKYLRSVVNKWKADTNIGFALYGTPAESLCYRFAKIDKELFGSIPDVTDKGYYTNSYHVDVREKIDAFTKLEFEEQFQKISSGGCISYVEFPVMYKNLKAVESIIKFIYNNIQYAEMNTKLDHCSICGYNGELIINDDYEFECPNCGNTDRSSQYVTRRTCGYLGSQEWNPGKMKEFNVRYVHLGE